MEVDWEEECSELQETVDRLRDKAKVSFEVDEGCKGV